LLLIRTQNVKSRLNPKKSSRPTLKNLKSSGVLYRVKVGLRHHVSPGGDVHYVGYNIGYPWNNSHIPNFSGNGALQTCRAVVKYNGERAELAATIGRNSPEVRCDLLSSSFPPNQLAADLLSAAHSECWNPVVYGDAVLVTDNRMQWVYGPYDVEPGEVEDLAGQLTTPHTLLDRATRPWILFHVEPDERDLILLKMLFL
jgi:hypothetical protein